MANGKDSDVLSGVIVATLLVLASCLWAVSEALGLAPETVVHVVLRLSLPALLALGGIYAKRWFEPMRLGNTWPFVLATSWWAIWPALDDWGGKLGLPGRFVFGPSVPWWASDGLQWTVLVVMLLAGAVWVWWRNRW